jgi:hypothetical protein
MEALFISNGLNRKNMRKYVWKICDIYMMYPPWFWIGKNVSDAASAPWSAPAGFLKWKTVWPGLQTLMHAWNAAPV